MMRSKSQKVLAVLGSPHAGGITAAMLDCAVRAAKSAGWHTDQIFLYEKNIAFCTGCRRCIKTGFCVREDDIQEMIKLIKECDVVVLAAPVYWANVPAAVKNLFDRLIGTAMEETKAFPKPRLKGKRYILLTACNTPFPFSWLCGQSRGAVRAMNEFFKTAGMKCAAKVVFAGAAGKTELPRALTRKIERVWK